MPDIFNLLARWWKQMILVIILAVAIVAAIVFSQKPLYLSITTALPASGILTDKAKIFNNNIEGLYPSLGNPDDLDKILGTAQLDTVYLAVAIAYNLWDHYKIEEKEEQVSRSAALLKSNSKVFRSEFGELKIKVWDTDKNLAPQLANAILEKLNSIHQSVAAISNKKVLESLKAGKEILAKRIDSARSNESPRQIPETSASANTSILLGQLQQYEELIGEYQLTLDTKPAVLVVVEEARASQKPDKPQRLKLLIATAVISFLFSFLLALYLERRKRRAL
jgi:hypothetical protein